MARDDFSTSTKNRLALRAGYQCSLCSLITIGPSDESPESVNMTGIAAHIAAAAPGGRRYCPEQTASDRSSIDNGIWLCSYHADLIDGDEVSYSISWLLQAKKNHELKIQFRQQHFDVSNGMITSIELSNLGLITDYAKLDFSNRNIIIGNNGTGKTLICEMIAGLINKSMLSRWKQRRHVIGSGFCHVNYFKNEPSKFTIEISDQGDIGYKFNNIEFPFLDPAIAVFYPNYTLNEFVAKMIKKQEEEKLNIPSSVRELEDDLIFWLGCYLSLDKEEIKCVIRSMNFDRKYFIKGLRLNHDATDLEIRYGLHTDEYHNQYHSFHSFSGGEQQRIILEICVKIAVFYSKFKPTILIIEHTSFGTIDTAGINHLLETIKGEDLPLQFFMTTMLEKEKLKTSDYTVWKLNQSKDDKFVSATRL